MLLWGALSGDLFMSAPTHGRYAMPGTVPRRGKVLRKYAGQPCQICGAVIPARQPQGAVGGMLWRGPYCSEACWQQGTRRS